MAASFANWRPFENYVQSGGAGPGMVDGKFVSGAMIGIFAGPPRLASLGGNLAVGAALQNPAQASQLVYPIGITQKILGHENRTTTAIYLHTLSDDAFKAMSIYEKTREKSHTDSHTK